MTSADYASLIAGCTIAFLALIAAGAWAVRYLVANDYTVTGSGSFKFARRAIPVPKAPAPRVVILPGDGVPDPLDRDFVVKGAKF